AAAVDVEGGAEEVLAHGRAFDVPARASRSERRIPSRAQLGVAGLCPLPQSEVARRLLFIFVLANAGRLPPMRGSGGALPVPPLRNPRARAQAAAVEVREGAIAREAFDAEVHVAGGGVCIPALEQRRDHLHHLGDVLTSRLVLLCRPR